MQAIETGKLIRFCIYPFIELVTLSGIICILLAI
jgi:hypothetical protein